MIRRGPMRRWNQAGNKSDRSNRNENPARDGDRARPALANGANGVSQGYWARGRFLVRVFLPFMPNTLD